MSDEIAPTEEQQEIVSSIASSPSSLMISAYAGTAKTTTLQLAAPGIQYRALALAFNKKIADELRGKMPQNYFVKTLNSLGHQALMKSLEVKSIRLDDRKLGKLVTQAIKDQGLHLSAYQWEATRNLVSAAMQAGISLNNEGQPLLDDTPQNWASLLDDLSSEDFPLCYDLGRRVLKDSNYLTRQGTISFDDQIYYPTILGGLWDSYGIVFVDESQDLSPLNHRMLELSMTPNSRLVAVGDSRQAIYAFRGADSSSMKTMRRLSSSWDDLPLTMTFRCPKKIVERQQEHAPGYRAWDGCREGFFDSTFGEAGKWEFTDLSSYLTSSGLSTVAVLCRNNAPLLSLAFKLLRRGIGCHMLGRDIGRGLANLTKKICRDDSSSITTFLRLLEDWELTQCSIAEANNNPTKADKIRDQSDSLRAVAEGASAKTVKNLLSALENLFDRSEGLITLSSIHRAKGLEWDCVIHLDPWRIPSKWALRDPVQMEQEKNLLYVAETRTKHSLFNLNLEDFQ